MPKSFAEWIEHRIGRKEDDRQFAMAKLAAKEAMKDSKVPTGPILGGKSVDNRFTMVLSRESIWRASGNGKIRTERPVAPWPSPEEFAHDGDTRAFFGCPRFFPLPRCPKKMKKYWKHRKPLTPHAFDDVWSPLLPKDRFGPEIPEQVAFHCIGSSLLSALDA
jgi:hypothetical protein